MECGKYDIIREGEDIILRVDCEGCPFRQGCLLTSDDSSSRFLSSHSWSSICLHEALAGGGSEGRCSRRRLHGDHFFSRMDFHDFSSAGSYFTEGIRASSGSRCAFVALADRRRGVLLLLVLEEAVGVLRRVGFIVLDRPFARCQRDQGSAGSHWFWRIS